ncbi:MAG: ABC transporter substrate-binding protein [Bacteroidales bacterium]
MNFKMLFPFGSSPLWLSAVFILLMGSCRGLPDQVEGETVFRYNEAGNITSLDPVYARNQANIWAVSQVFNGLVELDRDLSIRPAVASSWDVSEDGLYYTFILRGDVYFHDNGCFPGGRGRKVTASDFIYSFSRLLDPRLNAPGAWVMNPVNRLEDGRLDLSAPNDTTLIVRLEQTFPPFIGLLSMPYCAVVPVEAIERYGQNFRENPVGTGPFRFQYWKEGVKLVLRKNESYFEFEGEQRLPHIDAVAISFIIDRQTAFLEFVKGNLDFLSGVDASYKDELLTPAGDLQPKYSDRFRKVSMPFLNTEYLGILVGEDQLPDDWPLRNKKIRQAINYGFDREKMMRFLRNNIGIPAHAGFVPVGMPGFSKNTGGYTHDPERARQLLEEAGYPGGDGLPPISLLTNQAYLDIAQYIQFELSRVGVQVAIDVMPPATLREMMAKGEARFFRASWIADYPDAENYLALFYSKNHSPAGPNYTHFSDPVYDSLYEESLRVTDDNKRFSIYRQLDSIIVEQAPVVSLFYDQSVRFVPKTVKNMDNNPLNHLDLRLVRIETEDR